MRVALVGAGSIADWHLAGLRAAGCPAAVVAARRGERAREAAARHGVPEAVQGWECLPGRGDLAAAVVATPDATHAVIARAFLAAGIPVLVQKPLAATATEAVALRDEARGTGVALEVALMHRHFPEVVAARHLLRDGVVGRVLAARVRNATPGPDWDAWFWRAATSGGVAAQIGVHGMDLVRHLLAPIADVSAQAATRVPRRTLRDGTMVVSEVPDHVAAAYRLADGALVSHEMSWADPGATDRFAMEVHGERGTLSLRGPRGLLALFRDGAWTDIPVPDEPPGRRQHAIFLDVAAGRAPPTGSADDAVAAQRVIEAVSDAASTGRRVAVPP